MRKKYFIPKRIKLLDSEYGIFRRDVLEYFIEKVLSNPCIIYDPMAGTSPLVSYAETHGITAFFNDLNPVHYYINRAKKQSVFLSYSSRKCDWFYREILNYRKEKDNEG